MTEKVLAYSLVGLGSALGGMGRYWLSDAVAQRVGGAFPWGTVVVNVSGSFVIGLLAALAVPEGRVFLSPSAQRLLLTGVLGGYTTFSSFSLQTLNLAQDGRWLHAAANVAASLGCCLAAVWLGHLAGQWANR